MQWTDQAAHDYQSDANRQVGDFAGGTFRFEI